MKRHRKQIQKGERRAGQKPGEVSLPMKGSRFFRGSGEDESSVRSDMFVETIKVKPAQLHRSGMNRHESLLKSGGLRHAAPTELWAHWQIHGYKQGAPNGAFIIPPIIAKNRERLPKKNLNRRQQTERRRENPFVAFVCFCRFYFSLLVTLWLLGPTVAAGTPGSETQKRGGILRIARPTDPQTLDPALMLSMEDALLFPLLHLSLLDVIGGTNLVPCAAAAWSASPDQRVFTVHLRPGVTFSNGREVVARDYAFTLERMLNPATGSWLSSYLKDIRGAKAFISNPTNRLIGVKALSSLALSVELENPDPTFPYALYSCPAMPQEDIIGHESSYAVRPFGTGPYMVQEWVRGARLKLTRNPHYRGPEPQHFDGVDLLIGGDETTHLMMFERGELDIANITGEGIPRPSFRRLTHDPRWHDLVERVQLFNSRTINLNTEIFPFTNVLVRRAINHAIDRDRRMQVALGFYSHAEGVVPPNMQGYNPGLRGYQYNPEEARQLLRESGLPLPLFTELWHTTTDEMRTLAQGVQWDLEQVGVKVKLIAMDRNALMDARGIRGRIPMAFGGSYAGIPDPKDMLGINFDGNAVTNTPSMNEAFYNNPEVTRLLHEAAIQTDLQLRFRMYQRAEEIIVSDAPCAFLGHQNAFALRQPWLKGPLLDSLALYRFDRIWFEK